MRNTFIIAKRELASYFNSPIAYIVIPAYLLVSGYLFFGQVFEAGEASLRSFFGMAPLLFLFFFPPLTMRLLAEEKRTKTIELLITMPVSDWQVVTGKFLGALGVLAAALVMTLAYPLAIGSIGEIDWGVVGAGYIGLLLLGGAYIAIGLMASSWTSHQVAAALLALAITFVLWVAGKVIPMIPESIAPVVEYVSLDSHFRNIARGVLDTRDLLYYFSVIGTCLFMAAQSLESRRWS
jgi:ABC-2 type transport system permease protein